jgi:hypothetical protein
MADREQRQRVFEARAWAAPRTPLWGGFEGAMVKLLAEWDIMRMAVGGGWSDDDPYWRRARVVDAALQRLCAGKFGDPYDVAEFLVDEMESNFNAEIEVDQSLGVSRILCKIADEVQAGNTTGCRFILGDAVFEELCRRGVGFGVDLDPVPKLADEEEEGEAEEGEGEGSGPSVQVHAHVQAQAQAQVPAVDEDGFTMVQAKPRRSKRVGQQYQVPANSVQVNGGGGDQMEAE